MTLPTLSNRALAEIARIITHVGANSPDMPMNLMVPSIGWEIGLNSADIAVGKPIFGISAPLGLTQISL